MIPQLNWMERVRTNITDWRIVLVFKDGLHIMAFGLLAIILVLLLPLYSPVVMAQEGSSAPLTLSEAVQSALTRNPMVKATAIGAEIADAKISEAKSGRLPLLQFSETVIRSNNPVFVFGSLLEQGRFGPQNFSISSLNSPDSLNNYRTLFSLKVPLWDQRQTESGIKRARLGREQADKQSDTVNQRLRHEVIRSYYGVAVAIMKSEVAEEAVKLAEADVKRTRDRFETGLVVQSDLLAGEVQLAEFKQQRVQADGDLAVARAALNTVLGAPIDTTFQITDQLSEKKFDVPTRDELIKQALLQRPDYQNTALGLKMSGEMTSAAKGQFTPRVDLFATFGVSSKGLGSGSSDYTVGASVSFNIFDAGRKARIDQARSAEALAKSEQENLANQIKLEVVRAYQQFITARERLSLSEQAVSQSRETLRIVQDRYHEGLTTITEVLRAETAFIRARMGLAAARYEHYAGYANVLLASGALVDTRAF